MIKSTLKNDRKQLLKVYFEILRYSIWILYKEKKLRCAPFYIIMQCLRFGGRLFQFQLIPVSQKIYATLTKNEPIQSAHFIIATSNIVKGMNPDVLHWAILNVLNKPRAPLNVDILSSIMDPSFGTIKVPIVPIERCSAAYIFISSEFYTYLLQKYNLPHDEDIFVYMKLAAPEENIINLAENATINLINNPHELTNTVTDEILKSYFQTPRIIYNNHIQEIELSKAILGNHLYCKYFYLFSKVRSVYFRCTHLDSKHNAMENVAIVLTNMTNLRQTATVNASLSIKSIERTSSLNQPCPTGLYEYFLKLRSSIYPFFNYAQQRTNPFSSGITPTFLIKGKRGIGKTILVNVTAISFGAQIYVIDCIELVSHIPAQTEAKIKMIINTATQCQPIFICLRNIEVLVVDSEGREDARIVAIIQSELQRIGGIKQNHPIVVIALSDEEKHTNIQRLFLETIDIKIPSKVQREDLLKWIYVEDNIWRKLIADNFSKTNAILSNDGLSGKLLLSKQILSALKMLSKNSQGFLYGDLKLLYESSVKMKKIQNQKCLKFENFNASLLAIQAEFSDSLGVPKVPTVLWSDIGGLSVLKDEVQSSIELPLNHSQLIGKHLRRSGILLYGPPGTGKTLIAKAVATECSLNFLSVQGPELLNMYIGQSEQNVREVFSRARAASPCVVFLDELDSLAPNRGATGDSGGVMDRVVSQLLAEIDRLSTENGPQNQVFILAATNRPDLIDPALLRPGRFEKLFYVGPCKTSTDKEAVLNAQTKRFKLEKLLTTKLIAETLENDVTGADVYSICANAWMNAVRRKILNHQKGRNKFETKEDVLVCIEDFKLASAKFVPSVMKKDLAYYDQIKNAYATNKILI